MYEITAGQKSQKKRECHFFLVIHGGWVNIELEPFIFWNVIPAIHHLCSCSMLRPETLCISTWQTADSEKQQGWKLPDWGTRKQSRGQLVAEFLLFYKASFDQAKKIDSTGAVWTRAPSLTGFTLFFVMCSCNKKVTGLWFHPDIFLQTGNHRLSSKPRLWIQIMFYWNKHNFFHMENWWKASSSSFSSISQSFLLLWNDPSWDHTH